MKSYEEEEGNRVRKEGHEFQTMYVHIPTYVLSAYLWQSKVMIRLCKNYAAAAMM